MYSKILYGNNDFIHAHAAVSSLDGNYILAGHCNNLPFICKLDTLGNVVWNSQLGVASNGFFTSLTTTHDSCIVAAGEIVNNFSNVNRALIAKFDNNGDTLWTTTIDSTGTARSVVETTDKGFLVTHNQWLVFAYVTKLDSLGNIQWSYSYASGNNSNIFLDAKPVPDGGYVVTGYTESFPPFDGNAFLLKISSAGIPQWSKKFNSPTPNLCMGQHVEITDNGYLCMLSFPDRVAIIKTDTSGILQWSKSFAYWGFGGCTNCMFGGIHKISNHEFLLYMGDSDYPANWGGPLIKIDSAGNVLWSLDPWSLSDVIPLLDGNYVLIGNGPLFGVRMPQPIDPHVGIIKTDSVNSNFSPCIHPGSYVTTNDSITGNALIFSNSPFGTKSYPILTVSSPVLISDSGCISIFGEVIDLNDRNNFNIYPNPATENVTLTFGESHEDLLVTIFSTLGQVIYSGQVSKTQSRLFVELKFLPGIYIVSCKDKFQTVSKKLVIY